MSVFSTLVLRSNENKSCTSVDKSCQAKVCMRVLNSRALFRREQKLHES